MYSMLSAIQQNTAVVDAKIGEGYTWGDAWNVALCGASIVFLMLILLVVVIMIFGKLMDNANGKTKPSAPKPQKKAETKVNPAPKNENISNETDEDVVAAIAAAVGYLYCGTGIKPVIRAIKRTDNRSGRSAWANAGVAQNTRAF